MQGDKQRPFAVEALGDDNEVVGVEHFPGTDDRVEGTETGIVQYDIRGSTPPLIRSRRMVIGSL